MTKYPCNCYTNLKGLIVLRSIKLIILPTRHYFDVSGVDTVSQTAILRLHIALDTQTIPNTWSWFVALVERWEMVSQVVYCPASTGLVFFTRR